VAPPVLVARFERRSELAPIVRAALDVDIVYVALPSPPAAGRHTLQLWVGAELVCAVVAEMVGSGRAGEYPLRMRLLEEAQRAELETMAARPTETRASASIPAARPRRTSVRQEEPAAPPSGPSDDPDVRPRRTSASPRSEATTEDRTLASRPSAATRQSTPSFPEEEHVTAQTTVFDPDALLRAPVAPSTGSEDSMTIPRSSAAPPVQRARYDSNMPVNDESRTLPRGSEKIGQLVSWNVRIAPTTKDPLCGRVIGNGKYVLDSVIGTGAIGIVFKASHRDLGRTVAIKVLNPRYRDDPELLETFRSEARAASQLEHPNVARVYDYGQEEDGLVYIVMEYLSGYTLGSVLDARKKLTEARAIETLMQVCGALTAAHERGIIHRDVKPDNIVLVPAQDDEGRPVEIVKVCDFGIAALGQPTQEGYAAGSPEYMAPEQTTGSRVSAATDVYACGVVLYETLTGEVPFTDTQPYRIFLKHQKEAPRPPSQLTPGLSTSLEAVTLRCLEKEPDRRFKNARELRIALRRVASPGS
jgi:tRNA A-37 threonylcarbamoyl transferase component Bud32